MEPYERDPERLDDAYDDAYPYNDYYSTGGKYHPKKPPRNYGWLAAVLGAALLVIAGGSVVSRYTAQVQQAGVPSAQETAAAAPSAEMNEAEMAVTAAPDTVQTPAREETGDPEAADAPDQEDVLTDGAVLTISGSTGEELSFQEIYKKVIPSVVSITALAGGGAATGTGIIMSADGYIMTNYHVVSTAREVTVLLTSGEEYPAFQVGGDETSDLMVLKIEARDLTPAEFGNSDRLEVGDTVVAIGDPMGIELRGTMTDGIICGINRDVTVGDRTMTLIQTNAALNSGNSGGPLVNMEGQVIGVNTMKLTSSDYTPAEGLGFAIPISTAKPIVDELTEKGYVAGRPDFGFTVEPLATRIVLFYNLPGRLCIGSISTGSDAYEKGLREGDIIIALEGTTVSSTEEFNRIKNEYSAGDQVTLTVYHDGANYDVTVELMDKAELKQ